ncbi:MAG: LytR C-terminal domain-containing protein [Burkholderiales bacterium]
MRFQCRIGPTPPQPSTRVCATRAPTATHARQALRPAAKGRNQWLVHGAVTGAVLIAIAGCASIDSSISSRWKVAPVFSVSHSTQSSQAYVSLGQYFEGSREWDKAADAYRKAIKADVNNIEAYDALGVALAQGGHVAEAEITLRQAVALAPDRPRLLNNLGYVLLLANKPEDAVNALKAAVEQDASNAKAQSNLREAMARVSGRHDPVVAATPTPTATATPTVAKVAEVDTRLVATTSSPAFSIGFAPEPSIAAPEPRPAPAASTDVAPARLTPLRLEVSNGNGVTGMAASVRRWLATQGIATQRLSNRQPYRQQQTVVQYRDGQEQAALRVARSMPAAAATDASPTRDLRSDVRVVLGHDWEKSAACLGSGTCRSGTTTVAAATP